MFGNTISCEERVENRFRYQSGKTSKNGYEYLDDQLGSLKDKVKINQYQSAESVNDLWEARGYKSPYKEKTVVQNITLTEDTKFVRVYDGVNSNLEGGWVMRAEDSVVLKGGKGPWADTQPENGINERILVEDCVYGFYHVRTGYD